MSGSYYAVAALLVAVSSRTAAEFGQPKQLQTHVHDVTAVGSNVDKMPVNRIFRGSREVHDDLAPTAAGEERGGNFPMTRIGEAVGPSVTTALSDTRMSVIKLRTALTKAWDDLIKLQPKPSHDAAVIADSSPNPLSDKPTPLQTSFWDKELNMRPRKANEGVAVPVSRQSDALQMPDYNGFTWDLNGHIIRSSRDKDKRALAPRRQAGPLKTGHQLQHDKTELEVMHNAYYEVAGKSHRPTKEETGVLWAMMGWKDCTEDAQGLTTRRYIRRLATNDVVRDMMTLLQEDLMWNIWVHVTYLQKLKILKESLREHVQRWTEMYKMFFRMKPPISIQNPESEEFPSRLIKRAHPSLDDKVGESSNQVQIVHEGLQVPHYVEPTSSELMTKDFLSSLGTRTHSSLDDQIGRGIGQAPSMRVKRQKRTSSDLTTKDFLSHFG